MTEWRLGAFDRWEQMEEPEWAMVALSRDRLPGSVLLRPPKSMDVKPKSLDEVDPKLLETYAKLGIPLKEQMILAGVEGAEDAQPRARKVAVDAVFDSVSVGTTFQAELEEGGRHLLLDLGGDPRASRAGQEIPRLGCAGDGQLLRDAEFGCVFGRVFRLCAAGRALPDGAVAPISASMPRTPASSSAR